MPDDPAPLDALASLDEQLLLGARSGAPRATTAPAPLAQRLVSGSSTLHRNREAFAAVEFLPRAAVSYKPVDVKTTVLGCEMSAPIIVAPTGATRLFHPDGELAMSRAAAAAGLVQGVIMGSAFPISDIAKAGPGPKWQHVMMMMGRRGVETVIAEAKDAGCKALVVGVDAVTIPRSIVIPKKSFEDAVRFLPQLITHPRWLAGFRKLNFDPNSASRRVVGDFQPALSPSWEEVRWIREVWDGPLVVKGIMRTDDARRAVDAGADGIVVSNHGGSQPYRVPSLEVLPLIVDAVSAQTVVLFDGGIRSGADIAKAIALGARAVLVGRSVICGLTVGGEEGARKVLKLLQDELQETIALIGARSLEDLDESFVVSGLPTPVETPSLMGA